MMHRMSAQICLIKLIGCSKMVIIFLFGLWNHTVVIIRKQFFQSGLTDSLQLPTSAAGNSFSPPISMHRPYTRPVILVIFMRKL